MSESGKPGRPTAQAEETAEFPQDGDFLQRWSQRKAQARVATQPQAKEADSQARDAGTGPPAEAPGDEDMPPLETLDQDSDYSGFLSPRVSEELRRLALRKLFHGPKFNITDGMEGDAVKDPDSVFNGQRLVNGWKNSGLPWTYKIDPKRMVLPDKR